MKISKALEFLLLLYGLFTVCNCDYTEHEWDCSYINKPEALADLALFPTNDRIAPQKLEEMRKKTRVCLPPPCNHIKAFSGFIPVSKDDLSYMFFLHMKSPREHRKKPLLLWLQGGPAKSSLFGQFLENGPLGIDADGNLYHRNHTILNFTNVIYVDHPVGAGFSFDDSHRYPSTLEEMVDHLMRFLRRFLRLFPEYEERDFYIAGESYGARVAVALAQRVMTRYEDELPLRFKGVMLGVGFLFPLLDIINSTDYLYHTALLDENGRRLFAERFDIINKTVQQEKFSEAAKLLSQTVLNLRLPGETSLYQNLTGFQYHGSIAMPQIPKAVARYFKYANSTEFKKRIHVSPSRALDAARPKVAMQLALGDFFVDHREILVDVLNNAHVLFYKAQFDAVFPAINIERSFKELQWRGSGMFEKAERRFWHREDNFSLELFGYEKIVGAVMYADVLFGGHYVSFDRSEAVSDLYYRFMKFVNSGPPPFTPTTIGC